MTIKRIVGFVVAAAGFITFPLVAETLYQPGGAGWGEALTVVNGDTVVIDGDEGAAWSGAVTIASGGTLKTRGKLTVLAPEAIAGAALIRSTEKYSLIAEGEEFELPQALIPYISPVFSAFSLPEENARAAEGDGKKIAVEYGGGVYTVELSDGGKPERIEYEGVREFTLYNIIIQKG